jgi:hypothetical protein
MSLDGSRRPARRKRASFPHQGRKKRMRSRIAIEVLPLRIVEERTRQRAARLQGTSPRRFDKRSNASPAGRTLPFHRLYNDAAWRADMAEQRYRITRNKYFGRSWTEAPSDQWSLLMRITEQERLSLERLRSVASAAPPCISIVLLEREARDARIAFKHANLIF